MLEVRSRSSIWRPNRLAVVAIALGVWLAGWFAALGGFGPAPADLPPFERWSVTPAKARRPIAEELIEGGQLVGMPRAEVLRRLGPPNAEHYQGRQLCWFVGVIKNREWDFGLYNDNVFLEVKFVGEVVTATSIYISRH